MKTIRVLFCVFSILISIPLHANKQYTIMDALRAQNIEQCDQINDYFRTMLNNSNSPEDLSQAYLALSCIYAKNRQLDSCLVLYDKANEQIPKIKDKTIKQERKYYYNIFMAAAMIENMELVKSKNYVMKAEKAARDSLEIGRVWLWEFRRLYSGGEYEEALKIGLKTLDIYERQNELVILADVYNSLATVYGSLNMDDESLLYFEYALAVYKKISSPYGLAASYGNIGILYTKKGDFKKAEEVFQEGLALMDSSIFINLKAQLLMHYGIMLEAEGRNDEALTCFLGVLDISKELGMKELELKCYNYLAAVAMKKEQYLDALHYSNVGLELKVAGILVRESMALYNHRYKALAMLGREKDALTALEIMKSIEDSLKIEEAKVKLAEISKSHEQRKGYTPRSIITINRNIYIIIIILGISIIFITLIIIAFRRRFTSFEGEYIGIMNTLAKNEKQLVKKKSELKEKKKKIKELNHLKYNSVDLVNDLNDALYNKDDFNWPEFETNFKRVYPQFCKMLKEHSTRISPEELKICILLRMNLANKEIAFLLGKSVRTVETYRLRIRKKMKLDTNTNLNSYIMSIQN